MKLWTDYLISSKYIDSIYHENKPNLNNVDIHEIIFHRDGPKVSIRMNLNEYPENPPKKWLFQKFNTVQLTLALIDIKEVSMSGWVDTNYIADVKIDKIDEGVCVNLTGINLNLMVRASYIDVESIVAYIKN